MQLRGFRTLSLACSVSAFALLGPSGGASAQERSSAVPPVSVEIQLPPDDVFIQPQGQQSRKAEAPRAVEVPVEPPASVQVAAPVPVERASPATEPAAPVQSSVNEAPVLSAAAQVLKSRFSAADAQPMPRDVAGRAAREDQKALADYYAARNYEPVWRAGSSWSPSAASAITRLQKAGEDALDSPALRIPALASGDDKAMAEADLALSQAVVTYGRYASGGRIKPSSLSGLITAKPEVASTAVILDKVAQAGGNAGDILHGFNPPHPGYRALRAKLAEIRGAKPAVAEAPSVAIAPGPVLRVGMSDQRVPLIRARFGLTPNEPNVDPLVYDTKVAGAVASFQRSKGMRADGSLTPQTVMALSSAGNSVNSGTKPLEAEIVSNMERWRWLPRDLGEMHLMVNVPEFMVRVVKDGRRIHETRVITGAAKTPSPIFSDKMQHLIVNPYWHVPPSIVKEMGGPQAFSSKYEVRQTKYGVSVRQPPGPTNALGYIKFMFPNDHAVYLHDTPARHLFNASMRAMSHGCIRVFEPFKLAEVVMSTAPGWSEKRLKGMIGSGERMIPLPQHLPIHIAYFTTFVDENGQLQQRPDVYGHSARVRNALGIKG